MTATQVKKLYEQLYITFSRFFYNYFLNHFITILYKSSLLEKKHTINDVSSDKPSNILLVLSFI